VKKMEKSVALLGESSSGADVQSSRCSSSSRIMKRKSEEGPKNDTNTTETSIIHKKSRYIQSINSSDQSKTENRQDTNVKSDQTDASSSVYDVSSSESQIKSKTIYEDIETTTPANEPEMLAVEKANEESEHQHTRQPYYLQNFRTVLEAVLENEDDRLLFNEDDFSAIHTFQQLSGTTSKSL